MVESKAVKMALYLVDSRVASKVSQMVVQKA
jgi:hypothetical protein